MPNFLFTHPYLTIIVKAADPFEATTIANNHMRGSRLIYRFEEIDAMKLEITKTAGIVTEKIGLRPWTDEYM